MLNGNLFDGLSRRDVLKLSAAGVGVSLSGWLNVLASRAASAAPGAKFYLHTGYKEGVGGVSYPSLGAIVSAERGRPEDPMPNFVAVGNRPIGSGFLGARHQPLIVADPARGVENLKARVGDSQFD